jgi:hypothetical protein
MCKDPPKYLPRKCLDDCGVTRQIERGFENVEVRNEKFPPRSVRATIMRYVALGASALRQKPAPVYAGKDNRVIVPKKAGKQFKVGYTLNI